MNSLSADARSFREFVAELVNTTKFGSYPALLTRLMWVSCSYYGSGVYVLIPWIYPRN